VSLFCVLEEEKAGCLNFFLVVRVCADLAPSFQK